MLRIKLNYLSEEDIAKKSARQDNCCHDSLYIAAKIPIYSIKNTMLKVTCNSNKSHSTQDRTQSYLRYRVGRSLLFTEVVQRMHELHIHVTVVCGM